MTGAFPTLPALGSEETLAFFTHKSLKDTMLDEEHFYGDLEGLALIGKDMLRSAVYEAYIRDHEGLEFSVGNMKSLADEFLEPENVAGIVDMYGLMKKIRCIPSAIPELAISEAKIQIFYAFIGAVWTYRGPQSLFEWIRDLLEYRRVNVRKRRARRSPLLANEEDEDDTSSQEPHSIHNPKRRRLDGEFSQVHEDVAQPGSPSEVAGVLQSHRESSISLHKFHEIAQKLNQSVNYHTDQVTEMVWNVACIVDGISRGHGSGKTKGTAKMIAAQNAYQVLGWTDGSA